MSTALSALMAIKAGLRMRAERLAADRSVVSYPKWAISATQPYPRGAMPRRGRLSARTALAAAELV